MKNQKNKAIIILASVIALMTGCSGKPNDSFSSGVPQTNIVVDNVERDYMTLLYSSSDTFNPYTAKTDINRQLCKLLYEPLVKLDNEFNVSYSIAERVELKGISCKVTLKNTVFSDGTGLTAEDVVYSFNLAKKSQTEYGYKLYGAVSATASGRGEVIFKLEKADPYFTNVLDFPILKKESEKRTDTDGVALPPIGSGRYKKEENTEKLVLNGKSFANSSSSVKEIRLVNVPDSESLSHYVEVGAADMYYSDISDGNILRMSGKKVDININHIIYIGVNQAFGDLSQNALRQAISSGIDRSALCRDAYYNNAIAATGFFNPKWKPVKSVQNIETLPNEEITIENLEKIGYNSLNKDGIRKNGSGATLKFELLVNKENRLRVAAAKLIADQLSVCGFKISVVEKSFADYSQALASGNFQLYLAEVALTPNMDISKLVSENSTSVYGYKKPTAQPTQTDASSDTASGSDTAEEPEYQSSAEDIVNGLYSGSNTINDVAAVLQTEMPFIPICYRTGVLFYNDNIENVNNSSVSDIYFSIESYKFVKRH